MRTAFKLTAACLLGLATATLPARAAELEEWIGRENRIATTNLVANLSPAGTARGVVIASPGGDYYFHWVRDAALTMAAIDRVDSNLSARYLPDFSAFSRHNQLTPNRSGARGIGEPKFNVDGSAYAGDWGRPQDDGPALRASILIRWAERLIDSGRIDEAKHMYDGRMPTDSVIKTDLEYVSNHWGMSSFDLWEEVRGHHFYTRMVQRRALLDGARLAERLGDFGAARWYRQQASLIERAIQDHWDPARKILTATLARDGGMDSKNSGLDSAVILAVLHTENEDGFMGANDSRVIATVHAQMDEFSRIYAVNRSQPTLAPAIGRYPEDHYYGGNPWFLLTAAFAEYHYKLASALRESGSIKVTAENRELLARRMNREAHGLSHGTTLRRGSAEFSQLVAAVVKMGDSFLERVKYHTPADGALAEQIDRNSGHSISMPHLTWSYAAVLTAFKAREAAAH